MSNTEEVLECLKVYNLEQYANDLKSHGLDTLDDMKHLNNEDIEEVCNELNMPIFHKKRFKNACHDVASNTYNQQNVDIVDNNNNNTPATTITNSTQLSTNNQHIDHNNTEQTVIVDQNQPIITCIVTNPNQLIPVPTQTVVVVPTQQQYIQVQNPTDRSNNINNKNRSKCCNCKCKRCGYCCYIFMILLIYFFICLSLHFGTMYSSEGDAVIEETVHSMSTNSLRVICYVNKLKMHEGTLSWVDEDYGTYYYSDLCKDGVSNACSLDDAGKIWTGFTIFSLILFTFGLFSMVIFKFKNKLMNIKVINNKFDLEHNRFKHCLLIFTMTTFVLSATFLIVGSLNFVKNDSIDLCKQVFVNKYTPISTLHEQQLLYGTGYGGSIVLDIFAFVLLMILIIVSSIHYTRYKTK